MTSPSSTPLFFALIFVLLVVVVLAQDPVPTGPPIDLDPLETLPTPSPSPQPTPPGTRCPGPRRVHAKPQRTTYWNGLFRDRVIFKLIDNLDVELLALPNRLPIFRNRDRRNFNSVRSDRIGTQDARLNQLVRGSDQDLAFLNQVIAGARPLAVRPNFSTSRANLQQLRERAEKRSCAPLAHLEQYYVIYLNQRPLGETIAQELNLSPLVEIAFLPPIPQVADVPPATPTFETTQRYLNSGPMGIDARYAWRFAGGRGASMRIVDVEGTWNVNHEDLPRPFWYKGLTDLNEITDAINRMTAVVNVDLPSLGLDTHHGTAVAGVLVAKRDGHGVTGIVYEARWGASSALRPVALWAGLGGPSAIHDLSVSEAALTAVSHLREGDVILIEQHSPGPSSGITCSSNCSDFEWVPMEYFPDCFDAFQTITRSGIIVVEAGGNGQMNLDSALYERRFNRAWRDSGAIIVGASLSTARTPNDTTNSGSRIDLHAWGENVVTTGYGDVRVFGPDTNQFYTTSFGGTSSASPIVAGAVLSIQGILKASGQGLLTPEQMRTLLVTTGRPQAPPAPNTPNRRIGRMPNLRAALRDFDATSPSAGGSGGTLFNLRCPEGQALVGIKGRSKLVVDQISGICGNPAGLGSDTAPAGGNGGDAFTSQCGKDQVIVGLHGRSGAVIDAIGIECAEFKPPNARTRRSRWDSDETTQFPADGGVFGSRFGPNRCTNDRIGVGFKGGAGMFVDRIQLICSTQEPDTEIDSWTSAPVGTATGVESRLACGEGEAMVGISARTGGWFDSIGPICVRVNDDGTWQGQSFPRLGTSGGDGGTATQMTCNTDEAISGIGGRAGDHLYFLQVFCRPLSSPTSLAGHAVQVGAFGGYGGREFSRIDCPKRLPANGLVIRANDYVNQIQLICGARPESEP